jgi:hypothetical protein
MLVASFVFRLFSPRFFPKPLSVFFCVSPHIVFVSRALGLLTRF